MNRHGHFDALARALHWLMAAIFTETLRDRRSDIPLSLPWNARSPLRMDNETAACPSSINVEHGYGVISAVAALTPLKNEFRTRSCALAGATRPRLIARVAP